jgi:hypothetical protein
MHVNDETVGSSDHVLEAFAAELTHAAYLVALRYGTGKNWLELELELWKALAAALKKWSPELCRAAVQSDAVPGNLHDKLPPRREAPRSLPWQSV